MAAVPTKHTEQSSAKRIAIVNADRCKPKNCGQACRKTCPVVRMGKECITVKPTDKTSFISEVLCIGCGICVKKCPYGAIGIINLPSNIDKETTHRYGANSFKLHRLPTPRCGAVLGLIGTNGIGKSTALKIMAGKLKPNLGNYTDPPGWADVANNFRGSELQNYFTKILENKLRAAVKPQYVDQIPKAIRGNVRTILESKDETGKLEQICNALELNEVMNRLVEELSGGELQRFAIALTCIQKADVYMFDEPSSYLDIKQRLKAANVIRDLASENKYVIVTEHDLSVLDFMSDFICILYGVPGAYGMVSLPSGVRDGINHFLDGFLPTENLRFRETKLNFNVAGQISEDIKHHHISTYPDMTKQLGGFTLAITSGSFSESEIIILLGENGTGKTTMIKMLAGRLSADSSGDCGCYDHHYGIERNSKTDTPEPMSACTVRELLYDRIRVAFVHPQFISDVIKPLEIPDLLDQQVSNLSGGELQRVALTICLGKPADVYLIDEPSAYLDAEQRLNAAKVIRRFVLHAKKTAFIVEHDFMMSTYLADRVIVFEGQASINATANTPQCVLTGMNKFLGLLDVTFRREREHHRPRINKFDSVKLIISYAKIYSTVSTDRFHQVKFQDREQKANRNYFYLEV